MSELWNWTIHYCTIQNHHDYDEDLEHRGNAGRVMTEMASCMTSNVELIEMVIEIGWVGTQVEIEIATTIVAMTTLTNNSNLVHFVVNVTDFDIVDHGCNRGNDVTFVILVDVPTWIDCSTLPTYHTSYEQVKKKKQQCVLKLMKLH